MDALDLATGTVFLLVGVAAWQRSRWYAVLGLAAGCAWFVGGLLPALALVHRPLVVQAAAASVAGRIPAPAVAGVVASLWGQALAPAFGAPWTSCVIAAAVLALAASLRRGSASTSRTGAELALVSTSAALVVPPMLRHVVGTEPDGYPLAAYTLLLLLAGTALLGAEYRRRTREVTDIIELSDHTPDEAIQALRRLVHGGPNRRRPTGAEQALQLLEVNASLQADLESRLVEVRASRARLLDAATGERRRLERTLAEGAVTYLDQLRDAVTDIGSGGSVRTQELAEACVAEVDAAIEDLAQLARGLHPRTLTEQGLGPALEELAVHAPLPVRVEAPATRFGEPVETALWYACAEALTNLVKHAQASGAMLSVEVVDGSLTARISDNGVGGARVEPGGGLAGLADRLASVGGVVRVRSGRTGGTDVLISVPVQ